MKGLLLVILGPSGSGKDSVLRSLKEHLPDLHVAKRCITRSYHDKSEEYESLSETEFVAQLNEDAFLFYWKAHGFYYGIRRSILDYIDDGQSVIFNGSRAALDDMRKVYKGIHAIELLVSEPILRKRLNIRGRENQSEIALRLKRASGDYFNDSHLISNDGLLEETTNKIVLLINQLMKGEL